jgi:hypothetical protein
MINDPSVLKVVRVPEPDGRVLLVERRSGIIADHVVDTAARAYAVSLRTGEAPEQSGATYRVARDLSRVR